ncbi:hypothetical protein ADP64_000053 [Achromobacter phage phiAxp-2]|uniref:Uncharacterized protein n=1 Tax=Achromobacter phage phiAxp-2 TaxID=1664246 RepID=A0A0K2FHI1_9CAUD|nr:cysteine dioxygenase [Achromobacter phage phiAxp-2]ALA45417.1 hypothetical protein ADP64_000053 [Achromobacter phage phiAxp-2]
MERFLIWLTDRLPARLIQDNGVNYMIRFYLFTLFGRRFYIHKFLASDPDRGIHNHPWRKAWSFILLGWYFEELRGPSHQTGMTSKGRRVRKVRWFNTLVADTCHRVILPSDEPVWTLFVHTVGDVQEWGFFERKQDDQTIVLRSNDDGWGEGETLPPATEIYTPFQYPGGKKNSEWWKGAPSGRTLRENLARYTQ